MLEAVAVTFATRRKTNTPTPTIGPLIVLIELPSLITFRAPVWSLRLITKSSIALILGVAPMGVVDSNMMTQIRANTGLSM